MTKQTLKPRELVDNDKLQVNALQQLFIDAIALEDEKAKLVARTGRQYYAKAAIRKMAVDSGLFELVDVETTVSAKPDVELTDREKAERIVARNEKRGWQTSTEVKLVASGQAETFAAAKQIVEASREARAEDDAKPKAKRAAKPRAKRQSANALTTTRAE